MIKKFTLGFIMCLMVWNTASAQLPDGSIAPDFTLTDLNGNEWNLYSLLNEGKKVIIDFSATWCGPCWNYHQSKAMANLYNQHGPEGTGEYMVFFIEGDRNTNTACLFGAAGCVGGTQGNWVDGTPYPIIESHELASAYGISYFPTIYHVCPNRILTEVGQANASGLYNAGLDCQAAFGSNNGGILQYTAQQGKFCQSLDAVPSILFQNLGTDSIYSVIFDIYVNGELADSLSWEGSLGTYELEEIFFGSVSMEGDTEVEIRIRNINGEEDEAPENDVIIAQFVRSDEVDHNILTLELRTDQYPAETYWELLNENGTAVYTGGNPGIFSQSILPGTYAPNTNYTFQLAVPADGCYEFIIYDAFGDGICCEFGNGFYRLRDQDGNIMFSGGAFGDEAAEPFGLDGAVDIINNAQIVVYNGLEGGFCGAAVWEPGIQVQNIGTNPISQIKFDVLIDNQIVDTYEYTGNINPYSFRGITLNALDIESSGALAIRINEINNETHNYTYKKEYSVNVTRDVSTEKDTLLVQIRTDRWGYETYWEIQDDAGNAVAFGGNPRVGVNGGGARIAQPGDPGAYPNSQTIEVEVALDTAGCYTFIIVDDYGDGIENGFYRLREKGTNRLIINGQGNFTRRVDTGFEADLMVSSSSEISSINELSISPNPMNGFAWINMNIKDNAQLSISVYNTLGQMVHSLGQVPYMAGQHNLPLNLQQLPSGLYHLVIREGNAVLNKNFILAR